MPDSLIKYSCGRVHRSAAGARKLFSPTDAIGLTDSQILGEFIGRDRYVLNALPRYSDSSESLPDTGILLIDSAARSRSRAGSW